MIIYTLICELEHEFEGWFKNSQDMQAQQDKGFLTCPFCDSDKIEKKVTAPNVGRKSNSQSPQVLESDAVESASKSVVTGESSAQKFANLQRMLGKVHDYVDANFKDVGNRFAEEAISMKRGETEQENIKGTVNREQIEALADEGVQARPLPPKPIDKKKLN